MSTSNEQFSDFVGSFETRPSKMRNTFLTGTWANPVKSLKQEISDVAGTDRNDERSRGTNARQRRRARRSALDKHDRGTKRTNARDRRDVHGNVTPESIRNTHPRAAFGYAHEHCAMPWTPSK